MCLQLQLLCFDSGILPVTGPHNVKIAGDSFTYHLALDAILFEAAGFLQGIESFIVWFVDDIDFFQMENMLTKIVVLYSTFYGDQLDLVATTGDTHPD